MDDKDLERRKQEAEIAKLEAETRAARWHRWTTVAEIIKAAGAVATMLLVVYAATATYRVTQLETRLAQADKHEAEKERATAIRARDAATAAKNSSERELAALLAQVQTVQVELGRLGASKQTADVSESLKMVTGSLQEASLIAERTLPYVLVVPAESTQNGTAAMLAELLRAQGFRAGVNAPLRDIKNAPPVTEVDFFKSAEQEEAQRVLRLLEGTGFAVGRVVLRSDRTVERYRYYELRMPRD